MKEKKPKSPILVFATMIFLLMFIVLPPLFRNLFPVEEIAEEVKKDYMLTCIKVSTSENLRVVSKISYIDNVPMSNEIVYMPYAASSDEAAINDVDENILTAAEELALFRKSEGVLIADEDLNVVVSINEEVINNNSENLELANFLLPAVLEQQEYYEGQGYSCTLN